MREKRKRVMSHSIEKLLEIKLLSLEIPQQRRRCTACHEYVTTPKTSYRTGNQEIARQSHQAKTLKKYKTKKLYTLLIYQHTRPCPCSTPSITTSIFHFTYFMQKKKNCLSNKIAYISWNRLLTRYCYKDIISHILTHYYQKDKTKIPMSKPMGMIAT